VTCLVAVLALPLARGDDAFRTAGARVAGVAFLALVAAVVLGWSALVPLAAALAGGLYGVELAIADAPLDVAAPAVAAALLISAELAYWSLEERVRWRGEPGDGLRRVALVALLAISALLIAAVLLVLVDAVRARGLALDLLGATAALLVLATLLVAARERR
jgi:hypothetical protein